MVREVFIIWVNPLFLDTVRMLLEHPEIEVVGAGSEYETARDTIQALKPDTIIIEESQDDEAINGEIFTVLEASPWEPRVVRLSLHDNELRLYHRQQWMLNDKGDLLKFIRQ